MYILFKKAGFHKPVPRAEEQLVIPFLGRAGESKSLVSSATGSLKERGHALSPRPPSTHPQSLGQCVPWKLWEGISLLPVHRDMSACGSHFLELDTGKSFRPNGLCLSVRRNWFV